MAENQPQKTKQQVVPPASSAPVLKQTESPAVQSQSAARQEEPSSFKLETGEQTKEKSAVSFLSSLMKGGSNPGTEGKGENTYTKLFGKTASAKQAQDKQEATVKAASPQDEIAAFKRHGASVFDRKQGLLQRQVSEIKERKRIRVFRVVAILLTILIVGGVGFLGYELNPNFSLFGATISKRLNTSHEQIILAQTQIYSDKLRVVLHNITRINLVSDAFLSNLALIESPRRTAVEKVSARAEAAESRELIKVFLSIVKDNTPTKFAIDIPGYEITEGQNMEKIFSDRLISSIEAQRNQAGSDTLANRTFDSMIQLVRNRNFRNFLASINVEDLTDFELRSILGKILQEGIDDISLIAQLRQRRARWPELLSRIDELSRRVDLLYGKSLFESIGGIRYSNFEFDVDQGEVNISGLVKTEDTKTFTLMADLIDTFEKSPYFKDVDLRNFAKAKASGANFTGSIQLNFSLQGPDEVDVRDEANPIEAILGVPEVN